MILSVMGCARLFFDLHPSVNVQIFAVDQFRRKIVQRCRHVFFIGQKIYQAALWIFPIRDLHSLRNSQ
jgi:hypothetical protein